MKLDDKLVETLSNNEQIIQIVPADLLLKEWHENKGTVKDAAGLVSPALDAFKAKGILKDFGFKANQVIIKEIRRKSYVVFKGYAGNRKIFKGTAYLTGNNKIVRMAIGPKGLAKSIKGAFVLTFVLSVGIEVMDFILKENATMSYLLGTITSDVIKIGLSSLAGAVAAATVGATATFVAAPFIAAIVVGVATGLILSQIDKKLGATKVLIELYKVFGEDLANMSYKVNRNMKEIERNPNLLRCFFVPCSLNIGGGFGGGY